MLRNKQQRSRRDAKQTRRRDRLPILEQLEKRELLTVGAAGMPAAVAAGTGFDGVVQLTLPGGQCTGSLLESGRHILTAAHCVDNDVDIDGDGVMDRGNGSIDAGNLSVRFDLPGGAVNLNRINMTNVTIPASWNGSVGNLRGDIAVITLPELAPSEAAGADRYQLYRDNDEVRQVFTVVGYGQTNRADGTAVCQPGTIGTKRLVANRFDSVNRDTLVFDFDRRGAATAVVNEGNTAPGDSGGPSFINGQIAAVTSGGELQDCRIGDRSASTRVSRFAGWIDGVLDNRYDLVIDMRNQVSGNDGADDVIVARRNGRNLEIVINNDVVHSAPAANINSVTLRGSNDSDLFYLQTSISGSIDGGGGVDTLMAGDGSNRWGITGVNRGTLNRSTRFSSVENLKGGSGTDYFSFSRSNQARVTGTLSGGGGSDWLDYSNRRTSVHVNLAAHTATSTGGVNDIENVKGGSGNDFLFGDSKQNKLYGLGGDDFLFGDGGDDELYGGAGNDVLKGGAGVDLLDGGSGRNYERQR